MRWQFIDGIKFPTWQHYFCNNLLQNCVFPNQDFGKHLYCDQIVFRFEIHVSRFSSFCTCEHCPEALTFEIRLKDELGPNYYENQTQLNRCLQRSKLQGLQVLNAISTALPK